MSIWVFIEQFKGEVLPISWELLGKSRELANRSKQKLIAFILGTNIDDKAKEAVYRGADVCYQLDHPLLDNYKWETYSKASLQILREKSPNILIIGATPNGRDLAGRLAVELETGLTADVVALDINGELLHGKVPGFGGSIHAVIECKTARPQMATVRPGIFDALPIDKKRLGKVEKFEVNILPEEVTTHIIKHVEVEGKDISKAKTVVAGGRGLGGDISSIKKLANLLNADIGVTRPLCDDGLLPREHQIGSTGVTVKPNLTINFGISGAAHYTSGIKDSNTIISINTDSEATIFEYSDYEVVGDASEIMPILIKKLEEKLLKEVDL